MIDRYAHPAVAAVFDEQTKLEMWRQIEIDYIDARFDHGEMDKEVQLELAGSGTPKVAQVRDIERVIGHDVAAFLHAWSTHLSTKAQAQIHYGLTSSDVVDNVLFQQLAFAGHEIEQEVEILQILLANLARANQDTVRIGRTHGQKAEVTTWGWRLAIWSDELANQRETWYQYVLPQIRVIKTPGAVGNMQILGDAVPALVAQRRRCKLVASTQVIPRSRLLAWASWLIQLVSICESIAMEIRLSSRSEVGEVAEGASFDRVGSSAMPGKRNPIGAEQLSGLGRVARAQFAALAETAGALHHERDISNSSVERLVVPNLAELVGYMTRATRELVADLRIDSNQMVKGARYQRSSLVQAQLQKIGVPYTAATQLTKDWVDNMGWDYQSVLLPALASYGIDLSVGEFLKALGDLNADLGPSQTWIRNSPR